MSISIISGSGSAIQTIDPTSNAGRVTLYDTAGNPLGTAAKPLIMQRFPDNTAVGRYSTSSFRTVGLASANHNLFSIENPTGSGKNIGLVRLTIQFEATALSTTLLSIKSFRQTTLPTGGTILPNVKNNSSDAAAVAVCRGATASDGGAATAITATASTDVIWTQFRNRMITAAGYIFQPDNPLLPLVAADYPFVLQPTQALLVQALAAALTTDHYMVNCAWVEYT